MAHLGDPMAHLGDPIAHLGDPHGTPGDPIAHLEDPHGTSGDPMADGHSSVGAAGLCRVAAIQWSAVPCILNWLFPEIHLVLLSRVGWDHPAPALAFISTRDGMKTLFWTCSHLKHITQAGCSLFSYMEEKTESDVSRVPLCLAGLKQKQQGAGAGLMLLIRDIWATMAGELLAQDLQGPGTGQGPSWVQTSKSWRRVERKRKKNTDHPSMLVRKENTGGLLKYWQRISTMLLCLAQVFL